jgi:photosystem II stability/assembly factor-like uncharacterized protein
MKKLLFLFFSLIFLTALHAQAVWSEQTSPVPNFILYTVSVVDNNVAWIGGQAGTVLRTTDGGATWTSVGGGAIGATDVYNIFGVDAQNAVAAGYDGATTYMWTTTDGGSTWTQVYSNSGGFMDAIWMFDANNGFAYGDPSPLGGNWELYNTTDGGATWNAAPPLAAQNGTEAGWNNAMYVSGSDVYFGTNNTRIYHSTDMGNSWTPQTTTGNVNSYSIWFNNASTGLSGDASNLVRTTDGGNTWNFVSTIPTSAGFIGAIIGVDNVNNNPNQWWAISGVNQIFYSNDNGSSWSTEYTAPTSGGYYAMAMARNGNLIIAVRSDGYISSGVITLPVELTSFTATCNNGNVQLNWTTATEINNQRFDIQRKSENGEFVTVGFVNGNGTTTEQHNYSYTDSKVTPGSYVYRLDQVDFNGTNHYSQEVNVNVSNPLVYSLSQNYPNPFNPSTVIEYNTAKPGFVNLSVYNLLGQKVADLVNGNMDAGVHNVTFNASNLPSGMYIYEIRTNSFTAAKKMMLTK